MKTQATRNLYQTHAKVLSPLGYASLVDIAQQPFNTFRQTCGKQLSLSEIRTLYSAAQQHGQQLQTYRRKIVSRANPQLKNAQFLQANPMKAESRDYETQFGQRADAYVPRDSVASMFSPAAYLTELYREGSQLHRQDKLQHLNNRRPDLQSLPLSQSNLDTPISTLALSNDILRSSLNETDLDQQLASRLYPFDLPYHAPFCGIEAALAAQHSSVEAIAVQLAATKPIGSVSNDTRTAFANRLSPVLMQALLEPVASASDEASLNTQFQRHFGFDTSVAELADADTFCSSTGISRNELNAYLSLPGLTQSLNSFAAGYTTEAIAIAPDDIGAQYLNAAKQTNAENFVTVVNNSLVVDNSTLSQTGGGSSACYLLPCADADRLRFRYKFTQSSTATGADTLIIAVNGITSETRMVNNAYDHWLEFSLVLHRQMRGAITITHDSDSDSETSTLSYTQSTTPITEVHLLCLSRFIRYAQATGLSPATLDRVIRLSQGRGGEGGGTVSTISAQTPPLTARVLNYKAYYGVNEDDAVVLAGGEINIYAPEGQLSQFDKLFNNPPLHNNLFTTDATDNTISFAADDTVYVAQRAVLKRALGVDDAGLSVLATLCDSDNLSWARSLARMSDLYRVALWARVHDLSPQALQRVLALNGKTYNLVDQPTRLLAEYLQAVYATNQWLQAQSLSVDALYAMMTRDYPTTLTPEMDSLLRTLYQSVKDKTQSQQKETFAPHLAAALGLSGAAQARLLEDWIDSIADEQGLALTSMAAFWQEIIKLYDEDNTTSADTARLASFCQALGQLTLITKSWQLSTTELALLVHKPQSLQGSQDQDKLSLTLSNLQSLASLKTLQQAAGERASELLTALDNDALSIDLLAQYLAQPVAELTLATTAMDPVDPVTNINPATNINITQAINIYDGLSVFAYLLSPNDLQALLELTTSDGVSLSTEFQRHFGANITVAELADADTFCSSTGISRDELNAYLSLPGLTQSLNSFAGGSTTEAIAIAPDDVGAQYLNAAKQTNAENFVTVVNNSLVVDTSTLSHTDDASNACYLLPCADADRLRFRYKFMPSSTAIEADTLTTIVNGVTSAPKMINNAYDHWLEFSLDLKGQMSGLINIVIADSELFSTPGYTSTSVSGTFTYTKSTTPITTAYLLRLSQLIRYAQTTGLSPATLDRLAKLSQDSDTTPTFNALTARVLYYKKCYGVNEDDAVVLVGGEISSYAPEGQLSQFDTLFNNPPLHDNLFTTDDTGATISFAPDDTIYVAQRAALKQALGVDDAGLSVLATLCDHDNLSWARSLARMSDLYRVALWAKVHGLSPQVLQNILKLNGKTNNLVGQPITLLTEYLQAVHATDQLLQRMLLDDDVQKTLDMLHFLIAKDYLITTRVPWIDSQLDLLLGKLYQAVNDKEQSQQQETFALHLAVTMGLDEPAQARILEDWIDSIAEEQGLELTSFAAFRQEIIKLHNEDDIIIAGTAKLDSFCIALARLSTIIRLLDLRTTESALLLYKPQMLQGSQGKLSLTLSNLQSLMSFSRLQQTMIGGPAHLLAALDNDALSIDLLAEYLNHPVVDLTLAVTAMDLCTISVSVTHGVNITQASNINLWLQTAQGLGVSVSVVDALLSQPLDAPYASWQALAGNIQAGLPAQPALTMNRRLDEALSTALCAYYFTSNQARLVTGNDISLQNRDDLFQYLLIDNQVSAEIDTSRLAEAISSVQLYIHRCLQGLEANVDRNQQLEAFFVQWNQYNKRYSTWAGVSQLAYYPENYIDPTLRYNQTHLQQQLLSEISQSQLSSDSVETAYLNYLNGFEDIANLNVLCAYHHAAELDKGICYFVGRTNAAPYRYFWRSLNHEASDGIGGFVASAWTDWKEISTPINPVRDQVRPVIFNNRLYIGWVELRSRPQTNKDGKVVSTIDEYFLQLSYHKINNSWNPGMSFPLTIPAALTPTSGPIFDLYLSYHPLQNGLLAMLYNPTTAEDGLAYAASANLGAWTGGFINSRMQYNLIVDGEDADSNPDKEAAAVFSLFYKNLNGPSTPNKVIRYINAASFSTTTTPGTATDTTDPDLLTVSHVDIVDEEVDNLSVPPRLSYTAKATIQNMYIYAQPQPMVINTPGTVLNNSDGSFDVHNVSVKSRIEGDFCTHEAYLTVATRDTDYDISVGKPNYVKINSISSNPLVAASSFMGSLGGVRQQVYKNKDNQLTVKVDFEWRSKLQGYKIISAINETSNQQVSVIPANASTSIIHHTFSEVNPSGNADGFAVYQIVVEESLEQLIVVTMYRLTVVYNTTAVSKKIMISFAGDDRATIPRGPAAKHTLGPFVLKQKISSSGYLRMYELGVAASSNAFWRSDYTLGYSATARKKAFTYNWGEGEVPLLESHTTLAAKEYHLSIPSNGLRQTRTLTVKQDGVEVFKQGFSIVTTKNEAEESNPADYFQIIADNKQQALYLEASNQPRRTRLNTLFADELIQRASSGLDNVLNWDTQQLPEPQEGPGTYVRLRLQPYNQAIHGSHRQLTINRVSVFAKDDSFPFYEGALSDDTQDVIVFLPLLGLAANNSKDKDPLTIAPVYQSGQQNAICFTRADASDPHGWVLDTSDTNKGTFPGLDSAEALKNTNEPMDFSGANGLYFWELFYYTPMLVTEKLLQVQNFEDAESWLQYMFNPQGYVEGSYPKAHHVDRQWNVRPLAEDTAWDDIQTDSTDPDIVAQGDPMHYKVATYMKLLDLLIARGDMAYRMLQRDTLAEAKMWYVTALNLLGTESDLPSTNTWPNPSLSVAASTALQTRSLQSLEQLSGGRAPVVQAEVKADGPQIRTASSQQTQSLQLEPLSDDGESVVAAGGQILTANSLTALFLPAENDKLKGYWQTLNQRLFNLRHNLSLDGQPLTLPLYATPADPKALQSAAAAASAGGSSPLPNVVIAIQRFPVMLESARNLLAQLVQYGNTLSSVLERKDAEALNTLMQTQAQDLMQRNIQSQDKTIEQLQAEQQTLKASLTASTARRDSYKTLVDEGISRTEQQAIDERIASGSMATGANIVRIAGAALNMAPNIFGLADGGSKWGAVLNATAFGLDAAAAGLSTAADAQMTSEQYRRRAQEWAIQLEAAEHDIKQNQAQQAGLKIQLEAARLQKQYLQVQREQGKTQLEFLKTKFSNQALYSWMQGKLSALFYQFYDLAVARCMKAQLGYRWETKDTATFVQPGAWDDNHAGLLCGEALILNMAQMETAYQDWDSSALEVSRTVSMAQAMGDDLVKSSFNAEVKQVLTSSAAFGSTHKLYIAPDQTSLVATINLSALNITADYPDNVVGTNKVRRIKQISVSLPALLGPYQDVQALLGYSGSGGGIHQSCTSAAISHGINDSGQFQLNFNDNRYLPFEGLPIDGDGSAGLTLTFPNAIGSGTDKQSAVLQTLNDIIVHINYTIRS